MISFGLLIGFAFAATAALIPLVRRAAFRLKLVDSPDGHRKLHSRTIPLGGGVAILLGCLIATFGLSQFGKRLNPPIFFQPGEYLGLLLSVLILCAVGLADDRFGLRGRQKLFGQALACGVITASGLVIESVQVFGWHLELGLLAVPITFFWLLGAINSLNLIDGIDGLATTVGCILCLALGSMAYLMGHLDDSLMAMILAGSLLAFLCFNFPPASMFLGDTGSMLIGFVLGVLAIRSSLKGAATIALTAPTAVWAIPIFDTGMAILRRRLTGRSIYDTDRGHMHHCFLQHGYSGKGTLLWIGSLCAATAIGALISVYHHNEWLAVGSTFVVLGLLVVSRLFGHVEILMLGQRLKHLLLTLIPRPSLTTHRSVPSATLLQGHGQWDDLWGTLVEFADRFDLCAVQLNINLPIVHEHYHANWSRKQLPDRPQLWHTDIPLIRQSQTVGRLRITGQCAEGSACVLMGDLISGLKPFETLMLSLVEEHYVAAGVADLMAPEPQPNRLNSVESLANPALPPASAS
ncbi:MAG: undecaprenyl/decaprenyl-phosphate alpha-N-acetylglucosaminyl 1-phosphate transferase [Planctomycetia bacterium]|nr:undecaprenyl/decaprenyl-phosphate alpha-N-acetylglucosaminyl 1-phosphate transferase [Planctomycetia bacterium]